MKVLALIVAAALNPLVARTPEPHGIMPADCEIANRAPVTRVAGFEATGEDEDAAPLPPVRAAAHTTTHTTANTTSRTTEIKGLQAALATNDRAAFDAALVRAKEAGAPTRVYEDIARLWDAQFESPFFAQDSEAYRIANGYPGYEAAVRRQVLTDARGRKFYPAAESRAFLAQQVGVSPSAPAARRAAAAPSSPRQIASKSISRPRSTSHKSTTTTTAPAKSKSRSTSKATSRVASKAKPQMTVASREPAPTRPSPESSAPPRTAPAEPAPVAPPAVETSAAVTSPAAGDLATADTALTTSAPAPTTSEPTTTTEATVSTTTTAEPTATSAAPSATPSRGRSIVLPAILILIGLGVLILLFRTAR